MDFEFNRESVYFNVSEDILVYMEDAGISRNDLADKLGVDTEEVDLMLSSSTNLTLTGLSDICTALGAGLTITIDTPFWDIRPCTKIEDSSMIVLPTLGVFYGQTLIATTDDYNHAFEVKEHCMKHGIKTYSQLQKETL